MIIYEQIFNTHTRYTQEREKILKEKDGSENDKLGDEVQARVKVCD